MALPALSGVIMHVSPCHPRSLIFATATAMPALILPASKPGGSDGSEKSTVSGFWPTNKMRVIRLSPSIQPGDDREKCGCDRRLSQRLGDLLRHRRFVLAVDAHVEKRGPLEFVRALERGWQSRKALRR